MTAVLTKAFAFILAIALGYGLKRVGFFSPNDHRVVSKIVLNITMPAAVITSFASMEFDSALLLLSLLGLGLNVAMFSIGALLSRKKARGDRAFYMVNLPGYNIGAFTLPYVQSFLGPFGVVATCLFDTGNAIMCTGCTYSIAGAMLGGRHEPGRLRAFFIRLFSSVPFDTYLILLLISLLRLPIPQPVVTVTSIVGSANGFLAMFMIGLMFEIHLDREHLKQVLQVLGLRYAVATVVALACYFALPLPLELRQVLAIVAFAPCSAISAVFTEKLGGDAALSSLTGSISILISVTVITSMILGMGIGQ